MMVNRMDDNGDCGEIILDSAEPYAKKILECFTHKETLEILELMQNPCTICDICARSSYSKATLYRRISDLLDCSLLFCSKKREYQLQKVWLLDVCKVILCHFYQVWSDPC